MNIVLLGYRGTGKSVIGKILAQKLKRPLFRLDDRIAQLAAMPIPKIVSEWGWPRFREMESRVVEEVCGQAQDAVIDCGGGVILGDQNILHLRKNGKTVLLKADFNTIMKRIKNDANRPPLKPGMSFEEEQKAILLEREAKYLAAADMICDTTHLKPKEIAQAIIEYFKRKSWI